MWSVSEREEFEKGTIKRLSLSSDGKLTLAPQLKEWAENGWLNIVGGCCGTTPQHISAMRRALDAPPTVEALALSAPADEEIFEATAEEPTEFAQKLARGKFVFAVEMDPPRGLSTHKLFAGASLLAEAGADVINVADSPMARMRMSAWAVCDVVQRRVNVETTLHFPEASL